MISFSITVYTFVFMAICALLLAMIIGYIWYWKQDNFYINDFDEITYGIIMAVLVFVAGFMLLIGIIGFDTARYEATDYDIEAMVDDLRSDGIEVIEKDHNKNCLCNRYIPFIGKTKYYWYHNEIAERHLINKRNEE